MKKEIKQKILFWIPIVFTIRSKYVPAVTDPIAVLISVPVGRVTLPVAPVTPSVPLIVPIIEAVAPVATAVEVGL